MKNPNNLYSLEVVPFKLVNKTLVHEFYEISL